MNETNQIKRTMEEKIFDVINYTLLTLVTIVCLYPMLYVAMASVSDSSLLMQHSGLLWKPEGFSLAAFQRVFSNPMILRGYGNTLFVLAAGLATSLTMTSLAAYFFSRKGVLLRTPLMMLVTFTMFFSGGMIPFYLTLRDLHMTNTLWGLVIPFAINTYNMIILRTSFAAIPESLIEAATIDGCGHIRILMLIVLPLSKAILAVMVLYYGVGIWNAWFWASTILRERELYPLQVVLREILLQNSTQSMTTGAGADSESVAATVKYATIMVATIPVLFIYPALQKYFASGVMIGAVKE